MNYAQIRRYDIANGPGIRTSFFVSGCTHRCPDCFNQDYRDFNYGSKWTPRQTEEVISYLKDDNVRGLTILGGEPFQNAGDLIEVLRTVKASIKKDIWIYSGYTLEEILKDPTKTELLSLCDVLVDGPFIKELKDLRLKFRGSSNQRIIDVQKSLKNKQPILYERG